MKLAAVYSRELDGEVLTLTTSGFTYLSQHVLYDEETGSLWFHLWDTNDLTSIGGPMSGRVLEGIDSRAGQWTAWRSAHPNSKFLKPAREDGRP